MCNFYIKKKIHFIYTGRQEYAQARGLGCAERLEPLWRVWLDATAAAAAAALELPPCENASHRANRLPTPPGESSSSSSTAGGRGNSSIAFRDAHGPHDGDRLILHTEWFLWHRPTILQTSYAYHFETNRVLSRSAFAVERTVAGWAEFVDVIGSRRTSLWRFRGKFGFRFVRLVIV